MQKFAPKKPAKPANPRVDQNLVVGRCRPKFGVRCRNLQAIRQKDRQKDLERLTVTSLASFSEPFQAAGKVVPLFAAEAAASAPGAVARSGEVSLVEVATEHSPAARRVQKWAEGESQGHLLAVLVWENLLAREVACPIGVAVPAFRVLFFV